MVKRIIYPGTFDPITNGHIDILNRALSLFGRVEVVVGNNMKKNTLFSIDERCSFIKSVFKSNKNVLVRPFQGLLVDCVGKEEKAIFVRGLRVVSDFEFELQMAMMNRQLNKNIETIFLMPNEKYIFLSSSLIKEVGKFSKKVKQFVPSIVYKAILKKFA